MQKLKTKTKDIQKLSSTLFYTPVQGMFESRSLVVQQKQENSQRPNLKTSLMQAERYGHHLQHTHPNKQTQTQELPIQQKTLVIGGPANNTALEDIGKKKINGRKNPSYDGYIGNAYKYVNNQTGQGSLVDTSHITNPPTRIPDKFGGREHKLNPIAKIKGNKNGTLKHGPKTSHQPQGTQTQYLNNLGANQTLDITAHGTKSGKIGGYKPNELADLLVNTGLRPGQQGTINLRACRSAKPGRFHKKSPALKLQNELNKRHNINMNVQGFEHLIQANQLGQKKDINIFKRGLNKVRGRKPPTLPPTLVGSSA